MEGLVCIDQRVQLCRNGEHYMEIGGVDDLSFSFVGPDLLEKRLTVGAAAVAAGIVMEVQVAAVSADGDIAAKFPGLAGHDGGGRFALYRGGA